jgi:hypothetical protein
MNYHHWIEHFHANRLNRPEPDWSTPFALTEAVRKAMAKSLAEYQLGDGGGECRLIARDAQRVRGVCADAAELIDLWFAEEREHSRLLGCAVKRLRGEFVQSTFAFRLFNQCRRALGVQFELLVLLIVEIVSTGYYRVLRRHCCDEPIRAMCWLILRDEAAHIAFHRDRLATERLAQTAIWRVLFIALACACFWFLWMGHGGWFRTLGASRRELFREVRATLSAFLESLCTASTAVDQAADFSAGKRAVQGGPALPSANANSYEF